MVYYVDILYCGRASDWLIERLVVRQIGRLIERLVVDGNDVAI